MVRTDACDGIFSTVNMQRALIRLELLRNSREAIQRDILLLDMGREMVHLVKCFPHKSEAPSPDLQHPCFNKESKLRKIRSSAFWPLHEGIHTATRAYR